MGKNIIICLFFVCFGISLHADINTPQGAQKACDNTNGAGCFTLAYMYDFGEGIKQDSIKATELYIKSCDTGYAGGCLVLGAMYHTGEGVQKDILMAKRLYAKACDGGSSRGCREYSVLRVNDKMVSR